MEVVSVRRGFQIQCLTSLIIDDCTSLAFTFTMPEAPELDFMSQYINYVLAHLKVILTVCTVYADVTGKEARMEACPREAQSCGQAIELTLGRVKMLNMLRGGSGSYLSSCIYHFDIS